MRVSDALAHENPSTALCFAMHCVGTAVIAARATDDQKRRYLEPIAQGRHITAVAREFDILGAALRDAARGAAPDIAGIEAGLHLATRLLEHGAAVCVEHFSTLQRGSATR